MLWRLKIHTCLQKRSAPIPVLGACHLLYVDGVPVNAEAVRQIPSRPGTFQAPGQPPDRLLTESGFGSVIVPVHSTPKPRQSAPGPSRTQRRRAKDHSVEVSVDVGSRNMQVLYIVLYLFIHGL